MIEFKIRAYGCMELTQLYSSELADTAAYRKMNEWTVRCPGLQERLSDLGYQPQHRSYTPLEVRAIVDALEEPQLKLCFATSKAQPYGIQNDALASAKRYFSMAQSYQPMQKCISTEHP